METPDVSRALLALALSSILVACGSAPASPDSSGEAPAASEVAAPGPSEPSAEPSDGPVSPSPDALPSEGPEGLAVDSVARTTVEGLAVRAEPTTSAERLAVLRPGERVYLVQGPVDADGHPWFLVAPVEDRLATDCSDEASTALACATELGWAAAASAAGDAWLEPVNPDCPSERDTEAYLGLDPVERLACAGDEEWRLVGYLAPMTEGRGCFPVWTVDPFWMDGSCNFFFPQPVETEFDTDTSLQAFVPPELGECRPEGCPFDSLKGSWVEVVGQLDHSAARECTMVLNASIDEPPYPPIGPELTVFLCRLHLVVSSVTPTEAPGE